MLEEVGGRRVRRKIAIVSLMFSKSGAFGVFVNGRRRGYDVK